MVKPISEAIANTAKYIQYGEIKVAGDVLVNAYYAMSEGAWLRKSMFFEEWVVLIALPAAYDCREINDSVIYL